MTPGDPFRFDDAAYVLGALGESERHAFETHLQTCGECAARVSEVMTLPPLLAAAAGSLAAGSEELPDVLLPALQRAAARERRRGAWFRVGLGALAAACLIALLVVVWPRSGSTPGQQPEARAQSMVALVATPISADVTLVDRAWGTEIDLACSYTGTITPTLAYGLQVVDNRGMSHDLGSWTLVPGTKTTFVTGTDLPQADIVRVQISENHTPILALNR